MFDVFQKISTDTGGIGSETTTPQYIIAYIDALSDRVVDKPCPELGGLRTHACAFCVDLLSDLSG